MQLKTRRELDFYPTDSRLTKELLKRVDIDINGLIFECCAGDGAILKELYKHFDDVYANDINPLHEHIWSCDATLETSWSNWFPDWTVTNPPFNAAHQIIPLAWENSIKGIAMLLRLTYLEPAKNRGDWLQEHSKYLTDLIIFGQPRPSFTGDGRNDSCTTAWFVWKKQPDTLNTRVQFVFDWKHC